jgi:hypothetical protein
MFDGLTWNAIFQQWPWFAAAAGVFVVAAGLLLAIKPKSKGQEITDAAADKMEWAPTGRIDFSDCNADGRLMLQVEETRSTIGSTGLERREIRWRNATVSDANKVLELYHAQRNLAMSPTFTVSATSGTKQIGSGQGQSLHAELKDVANGQDMADVTLVPKDVTH